MLEIIKVLGTPQLKELIDMAPDYKNKDFPKYNAPPIDAHFLHGTDE